MGCVGRVASGCVLGCSHSSPLHLLCQKIFVVSAVKLLLGFSNSSDLLFPPNPSIFYIFLCVSVANRVTKCQVNCMRFARSFGSIAVDNQWVSKRHSRKYKQDSSGPCFTSATLGRLVGFQDTHFFPSNRTWWFSLSDPTSFYSVVPLVCSSWQSTANCRYPLVIGNWECSSCFQRESVPSLW